MSATEFERYFEQAVRKEGSDYLTARQALVGMGATALPLLEGKAKDPDWRVNLTAEVLIGWLKQKTLFDRCTDHVQAKWVESSPVKPITGEMSATKRAHVIAALGSDVVPRLLEMLTKTHEYKKQVEMDAILIALSYLADKRATMPLLDVVSHTRDSHLRSMSVSVLGSLKDARAVEPLLEILRDPANNSELRSAAAVSLGAIGDSQALDALQDVLLDERSHMQLRQQVAYALGVLGDHRATAALIQTVDRTQDLHLTRIAVEALGKVGDESALPALQRVLQQHPRGLVHRAAQKARAAIEKRSQQKDAK